MSGKSGIESVEVLIYGSTSAAVASAVQGSRLGLDIVLISPEHHIGGNQVHGLGATDIDNQPEFRNSTTVGGLGLELHERISKHYNRLDALHRALDSGDKQPSLWTFEPSVCEKTIKDWLEEEHVPIRHGRVDTRREGLVKDGNRIIAIRLEDGRSYRARIFIDASYEGDLLASCGVSFSYGREASSTYDESLAGIRAETPYTQFPFAIDPYITPGDPSSGLIPGVSPENFGIAGDGDQHLAAYSYRLNLTDVAENSRPITKPPTYDPATYELHRRFARGGGQFYFPNLQRLPVRKTDLIGSEGILATDLIGMNDDWLTATGNERQEIVRKTTEWTKGFLWYLGNDESVPEVYRSVWSNMRYPLDEFPDSDNFPPVPYIRDGRRMVSDYVVTQHTASRDPPDCEPQVQDPIAVAYWPTDTHCARRIVRDGKVHNEGFIFKDGHKWRPFGISYRCVIPKRQEGSNFLSPTCPSSSHVGYGALRIEHQFYQLGQACMNAAFIAIRKGLDVQDVPYELLKEMLVEQSVVFDVANVGVPLFHDEMGMKS